MNRRTPLVAALVLLFLLLGCAPDTGTVTSRRISYVAPANRQPARIEYFVTVEGPDGTTGEARVGARAYRQCKPGAAWPDCKRKEG